MKWLFDKKKDRTNEIWPFEVAWALGTTAATKALTGSGGLSKKKCVLEVP